MLWSLTKKKVTYSDQLITNNCNSLCTKQDQILLCRCQQGASNSSETWKHLCMPGISPPALVKFYLVSKFCLQSMHTFLLISFFCFCVVRKCQQFRWEWQISLCAAQLSFVDPPGKFSFLKWILVKKKNCRYGKMGSSRKKWLEDIKHG